MANQDEIIIITQVEKPPTPEEGLPPWMATFADLVTLLLCFFVLLLSFTNTDTANMRMMLGTMRDAFGVQAEDSTAMNIAYSDKSKQFKTVVEREDDIKQLASSLKKLIKNDNLQQEASISRDTSGVMLRVGNKAMFQPGKAELLPAAVSILMEVVKVMKSTEFNLMVRGHTDGEVLTDDRLNSNWELSATRAAVSLRWILEHSDVHPNRLKAAGFASSKPLVPSNTAQNKTLNRRVEFYFVVPGDPNW
ncbi:MAG: OmpA family protein [Proteobacteria bacterium]|nr:OmpA family protein [Pseudomonadota bacterium]